MALPQLAAVSILIDGTEVFQVVVTSEDPKEAEEIANAIAYILPNRIKSIIDGTSAKVVESAHKHTIPYVEHDTLIIFPNAWQCKIFLPESFRAGG